MKRNGFILLWLATFLFALTACSTGATGNNNTPVETSETTAEEVPRPEGWSEESHSNDVDPNYEVVFPQDKVNSITITIAPEDWEAMQTNMTELFGEPGQGGGPGGFSGPPGDGQPPADGELPEGFNPQAFPEDGELPEGFIPPQGGGPGFGGGDFTAENPMWVAATIEFDGNTWTNVGIRYKGNSSLSSSWNSGSLKLPFKLDFDEFEDEYPEIENQRFYGFQQLSLANGFGDEAYMRDAITYDLLEEAGLVAAETAFYEITLDYGEGPVNLGIYVAIEVIDDTVIERSFGDDSGNIYEGDGTAASLAEGTFDQIADSFQKENNEDEADWSDIETLYNVLHSETRTTDPEAWRTELESIFEVNTFLEWLAISTAIQHWDTYGSMNHNYYLYHNPDTSLLTWISWDHNLVLGGMGGPGGDRQGGGVQGPGGGPGGGGPRNRSTALDKSDVDDNWPLIRYLLDDPTYYERYISYLAATGNLINADEVAQQYQEWAALLAPYIPDGDEQSTFETAVQSLTDQTYARTQAVADFLASQE